MIRFVQDHNKVYLSKGMMWEEVEGRRGMKGFFWGWGQVGGGKGLGGKLSRKENLYNSNDYLSCPK